MADVCCPYCGNSQTDPARCDACGGLFESLSRQATQLAMGPWSVRDEGKPFMPGFSAEVLKHQVMAGRITAQTPVRGPTTHQFWMPAIQVPGVSRLLGKCHACAAAVAPHAKQCPKCEADLTLPDATDRLGLQFTTDAERAAAQAAIAQGRQAQSGQSAKTAATPRAASSATPGGPGAGAGGAGNAPRMGAAALRPIPEGVTSEHDTQETLGPTIEPGGMTKESGVYDGHEDPGESEIEALWSAAPTRRRRTRRGGPDPLLIGVGLVALLGIIVAGFFAMQAVSDRHEDKLADMTPGGGGDAVGPAGAGDSSSAEAALPRPQRSEQSVVDARAQAMPRVDQLRQTTIPVALGAEYEALLEQVEQAAQAHAAGDLETAFRVYREVGGAAVALDNAVMDHVAQMDEREQALAMQGEAEKARQAAMADDAMRWAPPDWALAEESYAAGEAALSSGEVAQLVEAQREFRRAVSDYQYARSQASRGFLAVQAGEQLERAIVQTFTTQELETFGGEAYGEMLELQRRGREYLEAYAYFDAQDAFEIAMLRLDQAERGVKRAHGVKFYAFAAGYNATDALIAVAAGDGLSAEKRQLLREAFTDLTLSADVVGDLPAGDSPDYSACAEVLVTQARDAIALELGLEAQLSYHIGFQFRIVQQTLDNPRLSSQQSRRISQSLSRITELAGQAGYSRALAAHLDTFKATLRGAEDGDALENARTAWRNLIVLLRNYDRAMPIVNPAASPAPDPELFPGSRG